MVNYATRNRFRFLGHEVRLALAIKPWTGVVEGNMALCSDGMYIFMADYDKCPVEIMEWELKAMQKKYGLGNMYLIESSPEKYHVICFNKIEWKTYLEILGQLRIDPGYLQSRTLILRHSPKNGIPLKLYKVFENKCEDKKLSRAHLNHYIKILPRIKDTIDISQLDDSQEIMGVKYTT